MKTVLSIKIFTFFKIFPRENGKPVAFFRVLWYIISKIREVRLLRRLLIALFFFILLSGTAYAAEMNVRSLQTECTVSRDGSCTVVMVAEVSFPTVSREFTLPIASTGKDVTVAEASFRRERAGEYALLHLQSETGFSGVQRFTVTYHLPETVIDQKDSQSFSVMLLYPAWSCPINRYKFTVSFPEPFESLPSLQSGYYGDLIDNYLDIQISDGVIRAELDDSRTLQDHESMQLSLELPQDYFDLRFLAGKTVGVDLLLFWLFLALTAVYWVLFLRRGLILPHRQAMPPVGSSAGAVPYTLTGINADLSLMVLQWASDGYLTVQRTRKGAICLRKQIDMGNERKSWETEIFKSLFRKSDVCDVRGETYRTTRKLAAVLTENYYKTKLYVRNAGRPQLLRLLGILAGAAFSLRCFDLVIAPQSWRWLAILPLTALGAVSCLLLQRIGGCMLRRHWIRTVVLALLGGAVLFVAGKLADGMRLCAVCVLLQLFIGFALRLGGKRTPTGTAFAAELLGFRRYLLSTPAKELQRNLQADPQYFYRVLPHADALCVARAFAASFDQCRIEPCDWLDWGGKEIKYAGQFYARYLRLTAVLRGSSEPSPRRKKPRGK